jgi:hypothetical protein
VALEFGTLYLEAVVRALRADNWSYTHHAGKHALANRIGS